MWSESAVFEPAVETECEQELALRNEQRMRLCHLIWWGSGWSGGLHAEPSKEETNRLHDLNEFLDDLSNSDGSDLTIQSLVKHLDGSLTFCDCTVGWLELVVTLHDLLLVFLNSEKTRITDYHAESQTLWIRWPQWTAREPWLRLDWLKDLERCRLLTLKWLVSTNVSTLRVSTSLNLVEAMIELNDTRSLVMWFAAVLLTFGSLTNSAPWSARHARQWGSFFFSRTDWCWCFEALSGVCFLIWISLFFCRTAPTGLWVDLKVDLCNDLIRGLWVEHCVLRVFPLK